MVLNEKSMKLTRKAQVLFVFSIFSISMLAFPSGAHASAITRPPNNLGLSAYWPFDEGSTTKAIDHSGNGNAGTLSGTTVPTWVSGRHAKALSFDGSSSYVTGVGTTLPNVGASANVTVSAWIKPTSTSGTKTIFNKGLSGSCFNYGMVLINGVLTARNTGNDYSVQSGTVPANAWTFVTIVFNGSGATGYINGVLSSTNASGFTTSCGDTHWMIGARAYNALSEFFPGSIDDVRVYTRALTAGQVTALYTQGEVVQKEAPRNGLLGEWLMNEATSTIAHDSSGAGANGTLSGTPLPIWVSGKHGMALQFDGANNYVNLPSAKILPSGSAMTVSAWVKLTTNKSWNTVMAHLWTAKNGSWDLFTDSTGRATFGVYDTSQHNSAFNGLLPGVWYNIVGIYDGTNANVYVNGVAGTPASAPGITLDTTGGTGATTISQNPGSSTMNGVIDDVRIYNRVLSSAEILQLYNAHQTALNTSSVNLQNGTSLASGLVGLWTFDGADIGTSFLDRSGNGFNGYLVGTNNATSSRKTIGKMGQAFSFGGLSTGGINLGSSNSLDPTRFTIAAWVKANTPQTYNTGVIYSNARDFTGSYNGTVLEVSSGNGGKLLLDIDNAGTIIGYNSNSSIATSTWTHVIATYDGSNVKFYINGVLDKTSVATMDPGVPATFNSYIGSMGYQNGTVYTFDGKLDDVRLYNRAITASEAQQLYLMGK